MISKFIILLILLPFLAQAATLESHINQNYNSVVDQILSVGFPEPMAKEMGQVALVRQLHEDGPNKKCDYSAVGMYPGDPNRGVMDFVCAIFVDLKRSVIPTPEGTSCYALKGENACIASALCIALLYDEYVFRFNFKEEEKTIWQRSKAGCPEHILKSSERYNILRKANNMYGPEGSGIYQLVIKNKELFDKVRK